MTTTAHLSLTQGPGPSEAAPLPDDLRAWFEPAQLVRLSLDAVADLAGPQRWPAGPADGPTFTRATLLTLLTYSYATGRFGSETIEAACHEDAQLRYLAGACPPAALLRRFRRHHRAVIGVALSRLIETCAILQRASHSPAWPIPAAPGAPAEWFADQAAQRIQRAVLEDSVAADL